MAASPYHALGVTVPIARDALSATTINQVLHGIAAAAPPDIAFTALTATANGLRSWCGSGVVDDVMTQVISGSMYGTSSGSTAQAMLTPACETAVCPTLSVTN